MFALLEPPASGGRRLDRLTRALRARTAGRRVPPTLDLSPGTEHPLTRAGRELRVRVLELADPDDGGHVLVFGAITENCLVRLHSACLYGDALGSQDCDCGPELDRAMDLIQDEGSGVLVYLRQEGRGAGLLTKARGLRLSEERGVDTFTAYRLLGVEPDPRRYTPAAESLLALGLSSVRLLTNNPRKVRELEAAGLAVTMVGLHPPPGSARAARYLAAKRRRAGHRLPLHYRSRTLIPVLALGVAGGGIAVGCAGFVALGAGVTLAGCAIAVIARTG